MKHSKRLIDKAKNAQGATAGLVDDCESGNDFVVLLSQANHCIRLLGEFLQNAVTELRDHSKKYDKDARLKKAEYDLKEAQRSVKYWQDLALHPEKK